MTPDHAPDDRLGWIDAPRGSLEQWEQLVAFAAAARRDGFTHTLVCGMGGSSLAPRVLADSSGATTLAVLDSTDPAAIRAAEAWHDPAGTLFVVTSKSGTTVETVAAMHHFARRAAPRQFVAITDPGTPLERLARERGWRAVFPHPADVGGRYAALTVVGMLPLALVDGAGGTLLERALAVERAEARAFGEGLAEAALSGRDKLVLRPPKRVASLALWIEQLVAESSGKDGRGVVPVPGGDGRGRVDAQVVTGISADPLDLGAEFLRWEHATWALCERLGVNAFDQPDVEAAKTLAREELAKPATAASGELPTLTPAALAREAHPGDYVAILAYLPPTAAHEARLAKVRVAWERATGCVATVSFGPRYLHSTGQLHKGGPNTGLFVVVTAAPAEDIDIPEMGTTFGKLERAQARGDVRALVAKGRRVCAVHLRDGADLSSILPG
jgi:hypothetical protein